MNKAPLIATTLVLAATAAGGAASAAGSGPLGIWVDDTGRGAIEIKDCGGALCGHVVWTRDNSDTKGCGKQIIGDAKPVGSGLWDGGWIYSPEDERKYDVELKPLSNGTLRVKGYAGTKLFSQTMIWTPAPADLARCGTDGAVEASSTQKPASGKADAGQKTAAVEPKPEAKEETSGKSAAAPAAGKTGSESSQEAAAKSGAEPQSKDAKTDAPANEPAKDSKVAEAETPEADDEGEDKGFKISDLKNLEFGNGYGVKETGNGKCRLKLPYVTITVKCPD